MRRKRWLGAVLVGALVLGLEAGGGGEVSGPVFPPGVEELLPHGVNLWRWTTLVSFGAASLTVLTVGDITGDGIDDIIASDDQTVFVFVGQRDGNFVDRIGDFYEKTWHDRKWYAVTDSFRPWSAALADLYGDRDFDLVVGTSGARHELHLFRNDGRGGLDKVGAQEIPAPPYRLWVLDFTGDGVLDILWWTERARDDGQLFLHKGQGGLTFGDPVAFARVEGRPLGLVDLDGDGFWEFVFYSKGAVGVLWGSPKGVSEEVKWPSPYGESWHGRLRERGGGLVELVLATSEGLATGLLGREGLVVETFYPLGPVTWVHLIDLTKDGVEDALVLTRSGWIVLAGKRDGGFHPPSSEFLLVGGLSLGGTESTWTITLAGQPALVVNSEPFPTVYSVGDVPRGESLVPFSGSYLLAVGDLSGNGAPDLVVEGRAGVDVLWNNGTGAFVRRGLLEEEVHVLVAEVEVGKLYLLNLVPLERGRAAIELWTVSSRGDVLSRERLEEFGPRERNTVQPVLLVVDLDGGGTSDALLLREDAVLVKWDGEAWKSFPWEKGNLGLAVAGRFTGKDMAEVALLSGEGVFFVSFFKRVMTIERAPVAFEGLPLAVAASDLDRDGYDDLVLVTLEVGAKLAGEELKIEVIGSRGFVFLARGETLEVELPKLQVGDTFWPLNGLALGDFTGDGITDLVFTTIHGAGVFVLPGRGDGTFAEAFRIPHAMGPILAANLDGYSHPELIGSSVGFNPYLWICWNGGGR